jgi:hypothetical protein
MFLQHLLVINHQNTATPTATRSAPPPAFHDAATPISKFVELAASGDLQFRKSLPLLKEEFIDPATYLDMTDEELKIAGLKSHAIKIRLRKAATKLSTTSSLNPNALPFHPGSNDENEECNNSNDENEEHAPASPLNRNRNRNRNRTSPPMPMMASTGCPPDPPVHGITPVYQTSRQDEPREHPMPLQRAVPSCWWIWRAQ